MKSQNNRWAAVLSGACCVASGTLSAQQIDHDPEADHVHGPGHRHSEIEEVVVRATPLSRNVVELSQSATVLSDTALAREAAASIGDTLARLPGLSNASFGQNIGRPVIRGMQGQRVGVLSNNMSSGDASAVSQDHAVSIEPFLADQIEVLRGPSTLLYGSGSIGGVVNTVTHTIPQEIGEVPVSGRAIAKLDSVSEQKFAAGRLDASGENLAFHANAFYRRSDDYEIPGEAELYPDHDEEDGEEDHHGVLENSFLDNEGGSLGASWIGATWRGGASLTAYSSNYGIPGANHHGHDHGDGPDEGHTAMEEEEEEMLVTIDLESDRWDAELIGTEPFGGFGQLSFKVAGIDYTHTEFEGAEIGTVFDSDTTDARVELKHDEWMGMEGAFGLQYQDVDFSAVGEEAFVPDSNTTTQAFFVVESWSLGNWQLDAGLRYEDLDIKAVASDSHPHPHDDGDDEDLEDSERRSFKPFSISAGAVWHSTGDSHVSLSLARAERAPTSQELFSHGPHIASQTFEIGDSSLDIESNLHAEIAYRVHGGRLTGSLVLYADNFSDYIYQQITGEEEDGLPVYQWSQQDADFFGGEIELRYDLGRLDSGHWQFTAFYDYVKAELSDGENVPLMPPSRFGLGLDWDLRQWAATVNWIHAMDHTRVADHETRTQGYDLLNSEVSWLIPTGGHSDWQLFLQGQNLLDEDIRNSTSHLKDQAPQAGRNFILGVRAKF